MMFDNLFGLKAALPSATTFQAGIATQAVGVLLSWLQPALHRGLQAGPVVLVIRLVQQLLPQLTPDFLHRVGPGRVGREP